MNWVRRVNMDTTSVISEYGPGVIVVREILGDHLFIAPAANMRDRIKRSKTLRDGVIVVLIPTRSYETARRLARRLYGRFHSQAVFGYTYRSSNHMVGVIHRYARFVAGIRDREIGGGERRRRAQLARRARLDGTLPENINELQ